MGKSNSELTLIFYSVGTPLHICTKVTIHKNSSIAIVVIG